MVIRSKPPAWSIALYLTASLVVASSSRADPLTDSFASGGKRPAHKPARKPTSNPANKGGRGSHGSRVKPAGHRSSPGTGKLNNDQPAGRGGSEADSGSPAPRRESSPDTAPAEPSRRTNRDTDEPLLDESDSSRPRNGASRKAAGTKSVAGKKKPKNRRGESGEGQGEEGEEGDESAGVEAEGEADDAANDSEGSAPFASMPSIAPRSVTLGVGVALMGRNFQFAAPAMLQHESSFPRLGFAVDLETFPLLSRSGAWWRQIGLGAFYASEPSGEASASDPVSGVTTKTPVKQARWGIDLRMTFPIGERLVLIPRAGVQVYSFTLSTKTPVMASDCASTMTMACLPDTGVQMLAVGGIARIGASPDLGFSLAAAYLVDFGVTNRPLNQIAYEIGTSVTGFALEGGASWRFADWLAIRASVPVTRLAYVFHPSSSPPTPAAVTYRSAAELLYGFSVGVAVFTK